MRFSVGDNQREDRTLQITDEALLIPQLMDSIKLDGFKEKTDQLLADLQANKIEDALKCINELNDLNGQNFYSVIGKLTRGLHDAISDLSIPTSDSESENNRTRSDLNYVISLTEDAAQKTLAMTEKAKTQTQQVVQNGTDQHDLIDTYLKDNTVDAHTRELLEKLRELCSSNDSTIAELNSNISEIVIAQNFQDLASQSLTKALTIIKQVENSLISLTQYANLLTKLSQFSGKSVAEMNLEESAQLKDNIDKFNDLNAQEHLDQDEVDNLLSSLGF
jgi:chemotaxis protein CheZ